MIEEKKNKEKFLSIIIKFESKSKRKKMDQNNIEGKFLKIVFCSNFIKGIVFNTLCVYFHLEDEG